MVDGFRVYHAAESAHEEATTFEVNKPDHAETSDVEVDNEISNCEDA